MSNTDQINKTIKDAIHKDSENVGRVVFTGLIDNVEVSSLPESIFKNYFLPCFLGMNKEQTAISWTAQWVSIAGTAMSEVSIIDDFTKQELFRVPPILNTTSLYMNKKEGDLGDIFLKHKNITVNNPTAGLNFLIAALNSKNVDLTKSIDHGGILDRWLNILKRYGYLDNYQQENQSGSSDSKPIDDYFDF